MGLMRGLPPSLVIYTLNHRRYTPGELLSQPGVFKLTASFDPEQAYQEILQQKNKGQGSLGGGSAGVLGSRSGTAGGKGIGTGAGAGATKGDVVVDDLYELSDDDDDGGANKSKTKGSGGVIKGAGAGGGSLGGGLADYPLRDAFGWLSPLNYEGG